MREGGFIFCCTLRYKPAARVFLASRSGKAYVRVTCGGGGGFAMVDAIEDGDAHRLLWGLDAGSVPEAFGTFLRSRTWWE